jgi:hypothetical protein
MNLTIIPLMAEITHVVEAKEKKKSEIFGNSGAYTQAYRIYFFLFIRGAAIRPI